MSRAVMQKVVRPCLVEAVAGACVYLACRLAGYPRSADEVSFFGGAPFNQILSLHAAVAKGLQLSLSTTGRLPPELLLPRIASLAGLSHSLLVMRAQQLCGNLSSQGLLQQVSSQALAAASLLLAALLSRVALSDTQLCSAAFISRSSLAAAYSKLLPFVVTLPGSAIVPKELQSEFGGRISADNMPASLDRAVDKKGFTVVLPRVVDGSPVVSVGISSDEKKSVTGQEKAEKVEAAEGDGGDLMMQLEALFRKDKPKRTKKEDNNGSSSKKHRMERVQTVAG
mmetsp:Transcript_14308/g.19574  ORF Transcript_14308/g.19574 Transcript_14308/m.19574 type:complete len:283 (+) Transcript_14308:197-1045(+)|eukprot:CAMPEP_0201103230 /NCGR_PEP_ID=MMETSP0812-20130820/27138_1 /ASSEMBLY_ACC=CAM_ASM_000668 /TAXON_ID=98059 /ORGANISM="Dinobryon sp., Strain UTEXLB2267" /LENGTH=282 /DNA_ID=CAMNT_0047361359 /DNA_START=89 /DNA_END=937 /DNA_ORIENTATION=-